MGIIHGIEFPKNRSNPEPTGRLSNNFSIIIFKRPLSAVDRIGHGYTVRNIIGDGGLG